LLILTKVHKQDTATLNQHAVAELLRERQLKQWWVARQIGVTPLTVNRWLTGKVRRISRDNLARLAQVLETPAQDLVLADETDVQATQVEQSKAARLLVTKESQDMFMKAGQLETYERLIKAVMHPNLPLADLLELYGVLTLVTGLLGDFQRSRNYARLKLDFAQRCGDPEKELQARINIVTAEAALGRLKASHRNLRHAYSAAESQGSIRGVLTALVNLIATYHVLGNLNNAVRCGLRCFRILRTVRAEQIPQPEEVVERWRIQLTSYTYFALCSVAIEGGQPALAQLIERAQRPYSKDSQVPVEALNLRAISLAADSLQGVDVDAGEVDELVQAFSKSEQFGICGSVLPSILLRRSQRLDEAADYLNALADNAGCQQYEKALIAEEWARVEAARGNSAAAEDWRATANGLLLDRGMEARCHDDPALEFGSFLTIDAKLVARLEQLTLDDLRRSGTA
jgi:DNA-binding Xre family transcriptional regulator